MPMKLREEHRQILYDYAGRLMRQGHSNQQVQARLHAWGVPAQQAQVLTQQMRSQFHEDPPPRPSIRALWQYLIQYWSGR